MALKNQWLRSLVETELEPVQDGDDHIKAHLSQEAVSRLQGVDNPIDGLLFLKEALDSYEVKVVCNLQTPKFTGMVASAEECLAFKCIMMHILHRTMEVMPDA